MNIVEIVTNKGTISVQALHIWSQQIMDHPFRFALHYTDNGKKGLTLKLAVTELSTGFDIKAPLTHPRGGQPITSASAKTLTKKQLKGLAQAATYNLVRAVGPANFAKAILDARLQLALRGLDKNAAMSTFGTPATGSFTAPVTAAQADALEKAFGEDDLPSLRHERDQLQLLVDQHGTMTGDTSEQQYEDLVSDIAELDNKIAGLENNHA